MSYTTTMDNDMSLPDKFISQDNKRLLWGIMVEHNVFNSISNKYVNNIKADFEEKIQRLKSTITGNDTILELNKKTILQMMEDVKKYKDTTPHHVPAAEVLNKKQVQFQKGLQTKQEEFNRLIQPVKPQTIDFSDKIDDEPIGSEMDMKLSQTIAWREQQLSQVLEKQNPVEASEWINNGKKIIANATNANATNANATNANAAVKPLTISTNHIKIGEPTNIDESSFINLKKVSFAEDKGTNDKGTNNNKGTNDKGTNNNKSVIPFNFMDKLKKKERDSVELSKADINTDINTVINTDINTDVNTDINTDINTDVNTDVKAYIKAYIKAELTNVTADVNQLLLDNKLILANQEKIMDILEQVAFQTGII